MEYLYPPPKDEGSFESFCVSLLYDYWPDSEPELHGRRGQRQHGVDIIDVSGVEPLRAAQCKWKSIGVILSADELKAEVVKALGFELEIGHYIVLTTSRRSTDLQKALVEINQQHRRLGKFSVTLLTWEAIEDFLRQHPDAWPQYIDPPIKNALAPLREDMRHLTQRIESFSTAADGGEIDDRLASARVYLDKNDYLTAQVVLRQLESNRWEELSDIQKFLTLTYLGQVGLQAGKWSEAGKRFLAAKQYQPDSERAQINEALGFEMIGDVAKSYALARQLVIKYRNTPRIWAILCRTAPDSVSATELEGDLPKDVGNSEEVLVAIAMRSLNDEQPEDTVRLAQRAREIDPKWHAPALVLADAKLQILARKGWKTVKGPLEVHDASSVAECLQLFDRAVELAGQTNNYRAIADALLERARAKRMLIGADVDADVAEAQNLAPDDASVLLRTGRHYLFTDRAALAIAPLRKCQTLRPQPDVSFLLAMALRTTDVVNNRNEWLPLAKKVAANAEAAQQLDAARLVVGTLCSEGLLSEAKASVLASNLEPVALECLQGWVALAEKETANAAKYADSALSRLTDDGPIDMRRLVAETLLKVGAIHKAVPILERIAAASRQITDAWEAVDAARKVRDVACIRRIGQSWRDAGILDPMLLDAEVAVLEKFAPQHALALLQELVVKLPDDEILRFRLGRLAAEFDLPQLICRDIDALPRPERVSAVIGSDVVVYLSGIGEHAAAIRYAYDLLRYNQEEPSANAALAYAVIPAKPPDEVFAETSQIAGGSAFALLEDGSVQARWYVIKDYFDGPSYPDDIGREHGLAKRVMGLKAGDRVLISGDMIDGRHATIKEIRSKFIYRAQKVLSEWEIVFPDSPMIQSVRLGEPQGEDELLDFTPLIRRTYERERTIKEKLDLYRENPVTVHMLAATLGKGDFETLCYLAGATESGVRCCDGRIETWQAALNAFKTASTVVVDISALATLELVGNLESLLRSPHHVVITTTTLQEIRRLRDERRERHGHAGYMGTSDSGLGLRLFDLSSEQIDEAVRNAEAMLDSLIANAKCVDVPELIELTSEDRETAVHALGLHGAESALLARRPGHILYTDDGAAGGWSEHLFGASRVWTQPVLASLATDGHLEWATFHHATAKMVAYDYSGIQIDANTFFAAAELADWSPSAWPLRQCLTTMRGFQDARAAVVIAGRLVGMIFRKAVRRSSDGAVVMGVLDSLADGEPGTDGVTVLEQHLENLFGLDVLALRDARDVFRQWKSIRGL